MFGVSVGMAGQTHKRQHTPTNSGDVACAEYRPMTHEQMFYEERGRRLALEQAQTVKSILVVNVCSKYARALTLENVCVWCVWCGPSTWSSCKNASCNLVLFPCPPPYMCILSFSPTHTNAHIDMCE